MIDFPFFSAHDCPTVLDLHKHVIPKVAVKWKDLGYQLFDESRVDKLSIIELDNQYDVVSCCKQMFRYWLESTPNASWNCLLVALRSPLVSFNSLAENIEQLLLEKKSK